MVRLTDDALFSCPFAMATDVGTLAFSDEEAARLRSYLLKGGFLWVDDFWGTLAWEQWSEQMRRVLPEYAIVDVPADHPVRHTMFDVEHDSAGDEHQLVAAERRRRRRSAAVTARRPTSG